MCVDPGAQEVVPSLWSAEPFRTGETAHVERIRYRGIVYDSARWEGLPLRAGDIIISTPPKCGTTWTQMICALLVLQTTELPEPLAKISPWIDMVTRARRDVFADLAAQTHRRIIKTHTPLDGLPLDSSITYISVGRDPRDVALSMDNHLANLDLDEFRKARAAAGAIDGIEPEPLSPPPPRLEDPHDRFWRWADDNADPTTPRPTCVSRSCTSKASSTHPAISMSCCSTTTTCSRISKVRCAGSHAA